MRHNPTDAEKYLWEKIRNKKLKGLKFRRQELIGNYIVDFVCIEKQLIIELDGSVHKDRKEYDANRTEFLKATGFNEIRFWNNEIINDIDLVLKKILMACNEK